MSRQIDRHGGLAQPLKALMSVRQFANRRHRLMSRETWRQEFGREHAITRGIAATALTVLKRGFWGRLRWLLFGR